MYFFGNLFRFFPMLAKIENKAIEPDIHQTFIDGEAFFKISNYDAMRPFFMSIVSASNHWMFISSNGGLTAGRKSAEHALFPYYTDDKITESAEITGSKSIFIVKKNDAQFTWEPFSYRQDGRYTLTRNLYKNKYGNKILFEEVNHDLQLTYRYQWNSSDKFGFVRHASIINEDDVASVQIDLLDGLQNILPAGVDSDMQNQSSNLVDAYKRSELVKEVGLGIYALSAYIVDKAEPSESLKANVAWSIGIERPTHLLSSIQLDRFRHHLAVQDELDMKAEKGAYFIHSSISVLPKESKEWMILVDVNKNHAAVAQLIHTLKNATHLYQDILEDIDVGSRQLLELNASADALQLSADDLRDSRHFSNTLFNIMRGGIFDNNYQVEKNDFSDYLLKANKDVYFASLQVIESLNTEFELRELHSLAEEHMDPDFKRLCLEYMPLKFSRRHGDPSRPWNKFSINTRDEIDGSKILDYEGNWRDIFQNWEALALSYPKFVESMIHKFLNATTFDGYNPYRVTKDGFDWETIEPDDPWSYIGYWGDHQIIYLLKFLEFIENHDPGKLISYFDKDLFVYANVPYKIKSYKETLLNPKDTIDFDHKMDALIRNRREELGADGSLLRDEKDKIHHVNFIEKVLATTLAKLSNFIPGGGIWMNTQRPEWNDANNALVGNGTSMVTLYYLRRFFKFFERILESTEIESVKISTEVVDFYKRIRTSLEMHQGLLLTNISDQDRKMMLDDFGQAGSDFRLHVYRQGMWGTKRSVSIDGLQKFVRITLKFLEHSIDVNKRTDNLYHAYNLMSHAKADEISISHLSEMLEGQVAVLSSGYLQAAEVVHVLDAMKRSALFREDQYSYLLYPNKALPGFLKKNIIDSSAIKKSLLFNQLIKDGDHRIIEKDINGEYHFNGNFRNSGDLKNALYDLSEPKYLPLVESETHIALQIFEDTFDHKSFTGRSGTFYGYEGLGSIYWHMVSKLALAVQECCIQAVEKGVSKEIIGRMLDHYYEIVAGIGVHKSPKLYGAFPTDPYSHTPTGKGAQQPGMTGQVKEDILNRFGELGVIVKEGKIHFFPRLLRKSEFLSDRKTFHYIDIHNNQKQLMVDEGCLCFTYCQIPVIFTIADEERLNVTLSSKEQINLDSLYLDEIMSNEVFNRTGKIERIVAYINKDTLK